EVPMPQWILVVAVPVAVLVLLPFIVAGFLRDVDAGTIRMVSWLNGSTVIYRGPGKSKEIPLLTTGTTLSSKVINVDLDITDQTADVEESGTPRPIKVRVLASAIVSVGDSDTMIKTAANRFFAKSDEEQISTLTDLLTSSGRRAINLFTHDQLFSAKSSARGPRTNLPPAASALPKALVEAEAKRQEAMGVQRVAELDATQIAQAKADAEKVRIDIEAKARAEGLRITTIAEATAESIRRVNEAIQAGGEPYFRYRQIEMLPQIVPVIAQGLADAKLVTIAGGSGAGAPETTVQNITAVIQTVLAAQLVTRGGLLDREPADGGNDRQADVPRLAEASPPKKEPASAKPAWQQ